jgi:hypothetical protein
MAEIRNSESSRFMKGYETPQEQMISAAREKDQRQKMIELILEVSKMTRYGMKRYDYMDLTVEYIKNGNLDLCEMAYTRYKNYMTREQQRIWDAIGKLPGCTPERQGEGFLNQCSNS